MKGSPDEFPDRADADAFVSQALTPVLPVGAEDGTDIAFVHSGIQDGLHAGRGFETPDDCRLPCHGDLGIRDDR